MAQEQSDFQAGDAAETPVLIRHTQDGRRVEVIGRFLCLDGRRETDALVDVRQHPNRMAIWQAAPEATHMAGRIPLTREQAARAQAALDAARAVYEASPMAISERIRHAADDILRLRIDE
ncbi:MAG: hypothetical protein SVO96_10285 [Pseudomonadota bacterium]|nr:hypothetical protein [Pseudomonadota bacterium]